MEIRWFDFSFSVGQNGMATVWWFCSWCIVRIHMQKPNIFEIIDHAQFIYLPHPFVVRWPQLEIFVFLANQMRRKIPLSMDCIHTYFPPSSLNITPDVRHAAFERTLNTKEIQSRIAFTQNRIRRNPLFVMRLFLKSHDAIVSAQNFVQLKWK